VAPRREGAEGPLRKKQRSSKVGRLCIPRRSCRSVWGRSGEAPKLAVFASRATACLATSCSCRITSCRYQHIPLTYFIDGTGCVGACLWRLWKLARPILGTSLPREMLPAF
jgi:hypothetical protein